MSRRALLLVAALALLTRVGYELSLRTDDGPAGALAGHLLGDERAFDRHARERAAGTVERTRAFYQEPLYPWLLAQLYRAWPPPATPGEPTVVEPAPVHEAVFAVQHLVGVLVCLLTATLGARVLGPRAGLVAGLLAAMSGPMLFHEAMLLKASLSLLVFVGALHLWIDVLSGRGGRRRAVMLGLLLGLGVLLRGNLFLLLGAVLATLVLPLGAGRRRWAEAGLVLVAALIALSPATVHNLRRGDWVLSTYQSGSNAAIGNPAGIDPTAGIIYAPLRAGRGDASFEEQDAVALAEQGAGRTLTGHEVSSWWWARVRERVGEQPLVTLQRAAWKAVHLFHRAEVPDVKDWAFLARRVPWLATPLSDLTLLGPLALLGLLLLPWRRRSARALVRNDATAMAADPREAAVAGARADAELADPRDGASARAEAELADPRDDATTVAGLVAVRGGVAVVGASLVMFYVMGRYRLTALPCLCILAAGQLERFRLLLDGRRARLALEAAVVAALVALQFAVPLPSASLGDHVSLANAASVGLARAEQQRDPDAAARERDRAVGWAEQAVTIAPAFPAGRRILVRALSAAGPDLSPRRQEAWEAAWRLLLLMEGSRVGHTPPAELLDGALDQVRDATLALLAVPSAPGGDAYAGPLLAWAARGVAQELREGQDQLALALRLVEHSLALDPGEPLAHVQHGIVLKRLGRVESAEAAYRRALALGGDGVELHNNLGNVLLELGRPDEAQVSFERALELAPGDPRVRANLERARAARR